MAFRPADALSLLLAAESHGRLAHAYLISGPSGSGKEGLALDLAAAVLGCRRGEIEGHPDLHIVSPESKSRRIVVEQMHEFGRTILMKPLSGPRKIGIVREVDRLQPQAANAFLKTLEEPPAGSHLLLLSPLPEAVLGTIRSRCIELPLRPDRPAECPDDERRIEELLSDLDGRPRCGVGDAFRFTREFQALLLAVKQRVAAEFGSELKGEEDRYRQATDGRWIEEREEQFKALTEAGAQRERGRLLHAVERFYAERLRAVAVAPAGDLDLAPALLRRLECLDLLRSNLERGTQEALALEAGFLEMICIPK